MVAVIIKLGSLLACVVEPWVLATYLSHVTEDVAKSNGVNKGVIPAYRVWGTLTMGMKA